jgi:hypothetical protein
MNADYQKPMVEPVTRRAVANMIIIGAVTAGSSPSAGSVAIDPVRALVMAHRRARAAEAEAVAQVGRLERTLAENRQQWAYTVFEPEPPEGCDDDPEWIRAQRKIRDTTMTETGLLLAVLTACATTLVGVIAQLEYVGSVQGSAAITWDRDGAETILLAASASCDDDIRVAANTFLQDFAENLRTLKG